MRKHWPFNDGHHSARLAPLLKARRYNNSANGGQLKSAAQEFSTWASPFYLARSVTDSAYCTAPPPPPPFFDVQIEKNERIEWPSRPECAQQERTGRYLAHGAQLKSTVLVHE